jgi:hypothetical protein
MLKYSFQQARLEDFTVMTQSKSFGRQQGHPKRRYPTANTTLRHNPEDGDNKVIRNVGILPHHYIALQQRRPRFEFLSI